MATAFEVVFNQWTLVAYSLSSTCLVLFLLAFIVNLGVEAVQELSWVASLTLVIVLSLINWVVAIGLQFEYYFLRFIFGRLTRDEWIHYCHTLMFLFGDLYSIAEVTVMYREKHTFESTCNGVFYIWAFVLQSYFLEKCHTLFLNLNVGENFERAQIMESYPASLILLVNCALGADSLQDFLDTGSLIYLNYTLRYLLLVSDLIYFKVWAWSTFEESESQLSPNYDKEKFRKREFKFKLVWGLFHFWTHVNLLSSSWKIPSVKFLADGLHKVTEILYPPPQSLLGYGTIGELSVTGVGPEDITEENKDCIICFECISHSGKMYNFGNDDPVKLFCGHFFHYHCLMEWFKVQKICPTCRKSALDELTFRRKGGVDKVVYTQVGDGVLHYDPGHQGESSTRESSITEDSEGFTDTDYSSDESI